MSAPDLPPLTSHRLLPPGIPDLTLDRVQELLGRFQRSDRRSSLFQKLREFVSEVRTTGWDIEIIIDGSFVMAGVDSPEDIDVILLLPDDWDMEAELRPFEYNLLLSKRQPRRQFGFDVFSYPRDTREAKALIEFFQQVNMKWIKALGLPPDVRKGIVRVLR